MKLSLWTRLLVVGVAVATATGSTGVAADAAAVPERCARVCGVSNSENEEHQASV